MNKPEAIDLLDKEMDSFRSLQHDELANLIDREPTTIEVDRNSGDIYQIEINTYWDDKVQGNIRVAGSIDGNGINSLLPLSSEFIKHLKISLLMNKTLMTNDRFCAERSHTWI